MLKRASLFLLFVTLISLTVQPASAQQSGPVYIVQSGDTLSFIASRFNVSINDLLGANPSLDPNVLSAGQQIVIPGLEGVSGVLQTEIISFGDSLRSLSRRTQVSDQQLRKLNRLVSPTELYVGISLIIPTETQQSSLNTRMAAAPGESLLELAVKENSDPWTLSSMNKLAGTWDTLPGDVLYSPTGTSEGNATGLPSAFQSVEIRPLPLIQGGTEAIHAQAEAGVALSGTLVDKPLHFFPSNNEQIALQGVDVMLEPGVYPLLMQATRADGSKQSFEQMVLVTSGNYLSEDIILNDASTIDPAVTEPEMQNLIAITAPATPTRFWMASSRPQRSTRIVLPPVMARAAPIRSSTRKLRFPASIQASIFVEAKDYRSLHQQLEKWFLPRR